jgi:CheY-like chemotaxis protein
MYSVLVISKQLSPMGEQVLAYFKGDQLSDINQISATMAEKRYRILVYDGVLESSLDIGYCQQLLQLESMQHLPLMVLTAEIHPDDKLKAFEIGCDDLLDGTKTNANEVFARITKSIFHRIANDQLQQRLEMATETARSAMVDNSDLGANIQFLLAVNDCDNLDQLGQQFFSTIERYGLSCSVQMRSTMGIKDMEAHGMAKDLESQLLFQLKDAERFIDFGPRTIVNYHRVSLLIKNMPVNDPEKYGAIKDNTFCLVQGLNARIIALEDRYALIEEKESLRKLSADVNHVMATLKISYQTVMRQIVTEVENATEMIQHRLPHLALAEKDEAFIESITEQLIRETNEVFNNGLRVDEVFERLEKTVAKALHSVDNEKMQSELGGKNAGPGDKPVELF